jgi:predicted dehydrogenase
MNGSIGFGLAGFGMIGRTHLTAMQANLALHEGSVNAKPRALYTRRPEACADLPFEKIYTSLRDLLDDREVKVLDICTPNYLHGEAAEAGFRSGKGVYCEKPLSHNQDEADKLRVLAEQCGLPNQCALIMRFRPMVNRAKDMLEAGAIGRIIHFRVSFFHSSYLDANKPMTWRQELDQSGGGAVMDLGIHVLDLTRYLLGNVKRLRAVSRTLHKTRNTKEGAPVPNNTDEYLQADLELENGVPGIMECSRVSKSIMEDNIFEIFGTEGTLLLHGKSFGDLTYNAAGGRESGLRDGKMENELRPLLPDSRQTMGTFVDSHAAAIKNMANWAAGLAPFSGTPVFAEAVKAQNLVHACLRSAVADGPWEMI